MKKEMFISVVVGLVFGLIITYGVYTARRSLTQSKNTASLHPSPQASVNPSATGSLVIHSPEDETVQAETELTVTGTTQPNVMVIVFFNDDEQITTADDTGHFSVEGELEAGGNVIEIQAINEDGQVTVVERTVVVSPQFIESLSTDDDETATDSAQLEDEELNDQTEKEEDVDLWKK